MPLKNNAKITKSHEDIRDAINITSDNEENEDMQLIAQSEKSSPKKLSPKKSPQTSSSKSQLFTKSFEEEPVIQNKDKVSSLEEELAQKNSRQNSKRRKLLFSDNIAHNSNNANIGLSLNDIIPDILYTHVFPHLTLRDQARLQRVSKRFYELITTFQDFERGSLTNTMSFRKFLQEASLLLRKLEDFPLSHVDVDLNQPDLETPMRKLFFDFAQQKDNRMQTINNESAVIETSFTAERFKVYDAKSKEILKQFFIEWVKELFKGYFNTGKDDCNNHLTQRGDFNYYLFIQALNAVQKLVFSAERARHFCILMIAKYLEKGMTLQDSLLQAPKFKSNKEELSEDENDIIGEAFEVAQPQPLIIGSLLELDFKEPRVKQLDNEEHQEDSEDECAQEEDNQLNAENGMKDENDDRIVIRTNRLTASQLSRISLFQQTANQNTSFNTNVEYWLAKSLSIVQIINLARDHLIEVSTTLQKESDIQIKEESISGLIALFTTSAEENQQITDVSELENALASTDDESQVLVNEWLQEIASSIQDSDRYKQSQHSNDVRVFFQELKKLLGLLDQFAKEVQEIRKFLVKVCAHEIKQIKQQQIYPI